MTRRKTIRKARRGKTPRHPLPLQSRRDMTLLLAVMSAIDPRPSVDADGKPGPCIWLELANDMLRSMPSRDQALPVERFHLLLQVLDMTRGR
jgi:hypothetical protein